jgi:hypothetical protein
LPWSTWAIIAMLRMSIKCKTSPARSGGAGPQAQLVISAAHKLPISPQMGSGGTRVKQ